ncbi:metalloendopeptidase, glycoprotease family [Prosthecochloris aestuarii DSM 271]|uniref:tRNA N6-adenosine threonylcarbamoyltransferase n=1 Tax=Prosthecochloris aestuarii (strain DSM 271 / SK 413) TaxID=290512 RepID=TSAD_PROA2|nr:tRNA (adenosine(37)-N6)-threonylcarbamoyltransferase complex transferase subunit TsaD [Prosthecochloris aestuarii]B4S5Q4.1 RecName: Full=tRNA N6-adenosine threonylcarbamoyltransferase; AltName: Full=N6-L-threonylcarbamoyladenine synthase; Short=t(6)A synthase; AltName: Full=t(6)A37 threonylcarbamoyladenosine biosynthesis protein TsaD; AltName: Full=tRNA threonylcarbamoyladenosine biosynthesis protein TsaD [Prosthecochloris aestuarii DSM 271]ACF47101.1 metalloendopeptidase, glycoprotease family
MNILGIETSCDETSAAVVQNGRVISNIISSQLIHRDFGGVVPELASREHERLIVSVVDAAVNEANIQKNDLDIIAATAGPGLIGAVMVGLCFAQGMAYALKKPLVPVNHIEAHIFSAFIRDDSDAPPPENDFISLTVSGGHTMLCIVNQDLSYKVIGRTIDDAAGEAFDKTGKMLGLDYPAGPVIDRLAKEGNPKFHHFPRALTAQSRTSKSYRDNFDFSFSGLKTSVLQYISTHDSAYIERHLSDIAASVQEAITSVLVMKTIAAAEKYGIDAISVAGGVSANSRLRHSMQEACDRQGIRLFIPGIVYSTDNAAMIATMANLKLERGKTEPNNYDVAPFASFRG